MNVIVYMNVFNATRLDIYDALFMDSKTERKT